MSEVSYAISCLLDAAPRYQQQVLNWVASLKACGASQNFEIFVHYAGQHPPELLTKLRSVGATLVETVPFGTGDAVYCNKLMQLETFVGSRFDEVLLTDTDLAFLQSPISLAGTGAIRAKVVDISNPNEEAVLELLRRAGFHSEALGATPDFALERRTHRFNCNGGFYVLPRGVLPELAQSWPHWSSFCLQQKDLLGRSLIHSDQLGFMLALISLNHPFKALPLEFNFPTHFAPDKYRHVHCNQMGALHYHDRMTSSGVLELSGSQALDVAIKRANSIISNSAANLGFDDVRTLIDQRP